MSVRTFLPRALQLLLYPGTGRGFSFNSELSKQQRVQQQAQTNTALPQVDSFVRNTTCLKSPYCLTREMQTPMPIAAAATPYLYHDCHMLDEPLALLSFESRNF